MIPGSEDMFLRTAGGLYVAWPLDVLSHWGGWTYVEVIVTPPRYNPYTHDGIQVIPKRALLEEEVWALRSRPLLFWGMKVTHAPWALVMCRKASNVQAQCTCEGGYSDPARAIGV